MIRLNDALREDIQERLSWQQQLHCWRALNGGEQPLTLGEVAQQMGVDPSHLSRVLTGDRPLAGKVYEFLAQIGGANED